MAKRRKANRSESRPGRKRRWLFLGALLVGLHRRRGRLWVTQARAAQHQRGPRGAKILDIQAGMPFQILIPGLPAQAV